MKFKTNKIITLMMLVMMLAMCSIGAQAAINSTTLEATSVEDYTATLNGELTDINTSVSVTAYFEYKEVGAIVWENSSSTTLSAIGTYSITVADLDAETDYVFRSKITNTTTTKISSVESTFTTLEDITADATAGIAGIKSTTFIAFGLIAVMLLAAIAMGFITMIQNGADTATLITLTVLSIGITIVLFVGFIIMNSVAIGIIAGV